MRINLTQHMAQPEQGCVEPETKGAVQALLTFDEMPDAAEILRTAGDLAAIAIDHGATEAMIGGAPFLMPALERALRRCGVTPLYAFSRRESVDLPDGKKTSIFRHIGFVPGLLED